MSAIRLYFDVDSMERALIAQSAIAFGCC